MAELVWILTIAFWLFCGWSIYCSIRAIRLLRKSTALHQDSIDRLDAAVTMEDIKIALDVSSANTRVANGYRAEADVWNTRILHPFRK